MKFSDLASRANLRLAWRRITTGSNLQYKRLFRSLYLAYEVALDANLLDLRERLIGGAFTPRHPERFYVPKASGLHRALGLLNIEDQIVLQALANLAARRVQARRAPLQFRAVFSNILTKPDNIYFFRRWQNTYRAFQERIRSHYDNGRRWMGEFDLTAFYDTISHELLLRTVFPRTHSAELERIRVFLGTWGSDSPALGHGHGLPQGPLASDLLAECFMLPIDLALKRHSGYLRYVDDVRFFCATEDEVRGHLLALERHCRERGLIPHAGKLAVKRAASAEDAMKMLPSLSDPQREAGTQRIDRRWAQRTLLAAVVGRPPRVRDKARLRYVLYRAEPDPALLRLALRLVPLHPEHADALFAYLGRFNYRKPIEQLCLRLINQNPYPYVRGEAWHILARYRLEQRSLVTRTPGPITTAAIATAKQRTQESLVERWGACHFLCVSETVTRRRYSRFLSSQPPLLQSLLGPALPGTAFAQGRLVESYLAQEPPEPGLSVCSALHERRLKLSTFGLKPRQLASQVANTLRGLALISTPRRQVDPIAEILGVRYDAPRGKSWRVLLGNQYSHAVGLLRQAEAAFIGGPSSWLSNQNAFNQTLFLALQRHLARAAHPAACSIIDKNGHLVDFGVTLDANGKFSIHCPNIGSCFRAMNARRNRLPMSHPYEKKTAAPSRHLEVRERNQFVARLRTAYTDLVALLP